MPVSSKTIETQYGKADRIWIMDRGIPTEDTLWQMRQYYLQLTEIEQAFKELKGDLAIRPIYHQLEKRIEAHIFLSFLSYCLQVTLKGRLKRFASGMTPCAVLEKFAAVQMLDVHFPTTDGREIVLARHTQPEKDLQPLLHHLQLKLPEQAPAKIQTPPPPPNWQNL